MKYPYTFEECRKETLKQFKIYYPKLYTEDDEAKRRYERKDKSYFKDMIELEVKPTISCISMF